jgi:hypothetical protein
LTAPSAFIRQRTWPSDVRSEYTVPSSEPKYSRPESMTGEDSERLGSLRDQRVRPSTASTAATRPPLEPRKRCSNVTYTVSPSHAGDAAASDPILRVHATRPSRRLIAYSAPLFFSRNSRRPQITGVNSRRTRPVTDHASRKGGRSAIRTGR